MTRLCRRCWHERDAHEHYSPATWCSACDGCPRFRWVTWPWTRRRRVRIPPVPAPVRETPREEAA